MSKKRAKQACKLQAKQSKSCQTFCVHRWCCSFIFAHSCSCSGCSHCSDHGEPHRGTICGLWQRDAADALRWTLEPHAGDVRQGVADAHTVLGIALACICCVWGALVVLPERVGKKQCYAAAGTARPQPDST